MLNDIFTKKLLIGEIINEAVQLYKTNFKLYLNLGIIFLVPVLLLTLFTYEQVAEFQNILTNFTPSDITMTFFKSIRPLLFVSIIESVLFYLYNLTVVSLTSSIIENEITNSWLILKRLTIHLFAIFLTNILMFLMVTFGYILFIIPGFILMAMLIYVPQAMIIEKKYYFSAFDRSFFIIKKNFWGSLMIPIVFYFVYMFISSISGLLIGIFTAAPNFLNIVKTGEITNEAVSISKWLQLADRVLTYIVFILVTPIGNIGLTLKFINLRSLKEGSPIINELNTFIDDNSYISNDDEEDD